MFLIRYTAVVALLCVDFEVIGVVTFGSETQKENLLLAPSILPYLFRSA